MLWALVIFAVTYALMIIMPRFRGIIAGTGAVVFIFTGLLPVNIAMKAIDWNVLMMMGGTMGIVSFFTASGMPLRIADIVIGRVKTMGGAIIALSVFASVVSAFVDNVATVLMIAPVAFAAAKKQRTNPVPVLIAISVASNLQGAATLVGDTTSIILGGYAGMDFLDFFWFNGRIGIFWVVQAGCAAATLVLAVIFRKMKRPVFRQEISTVQDYFPTILMLLLLVLLIGASFVHNKPENTNGIICISLFCVGLMRELLVGHRDIAIRAMEEIDLQTLVLLGAIFIMVSGIKHVGLIDAVSLLIKSLCGDSLFFTYTVIVWCSVAASAFIDNIPYVAAMLPVVTSLGENLGGGVFVLYYGLLIGATLGGNLTPVGASANITAIGILEKNGYNVSNRDFCRIGVPYTLAAIISGYVLLWFVWI